MSLLNFSSPFLATPNPPTTNYYHHNILPQIPQNPVPYSYPPPQNPFLHEDFGGKNVHHYPHHHQPQQNQQHLSNPQQQLHQQQQNPQRPQHQLLHNSNVGVGSPNQPIQQQPAYTKVTDDGTKTKVHAVIDYDDYEEDDGDDGGVLGGRGLPPAVTPIQGPIYIKNGSVPVVPLYSHPVLNNGTFVQIPILWTALSVALGLELRGEYIRGVPCIKRHQQLFCPTAGNSYPLDRIELFIDENKALMKRMYGEFDMGSEYGPAPGPGKKRKRSTKPGVPDLHFDPGPHPEGKSGSTESFMNKVRSPRQNFRNNQSSESGRVDACESKVEIVTPYWASNSAGKIRAIVNTQHFEQAIHQEVCAKVRTNRCSGDCGCEQKYKWHRLLAYDPDNDCKGIFMDWFLFPSCCVCRCNPT